MLDHTKGQKCPDPELIQQILQQSTGFVGEICMEDRICYACYKAHLVLIKQHTSSTTISTDQDLTSKIENLKSELQNEKEIHTPDHALSYSVCKSAILVGEKILEQNAILLPEVYDYFNKMYADITMSQSIVGLNTTVSSNWLLSELSAILEHHMAYRCSVRRYGTVLYRYGGDLLHALNVSLGQSRSTKNHPEKEMDSDLQFQKNLSDVCHTLNAKCHACTQK